jgi:2-haloacid dehalogenase
VEEGLQLLKDNGFRLATLTNSPPLALKQQLINSNLTDYFEQALSIDSLKNTNQQQKPIYGQQRTSVKPEEMLMIAAHGWDLAGASHAGLAAFAPLPVKGSPVSSTLILSHNI